MTRLVLIASLLLAVVLCIAGQRSTSVEYIDPCADFVTWQDANDQFITAGGPVLDLPILDGDGYPCESLPGAPPEGANATVGVYPRGGNASAGMSRPPDVSDESPVASPSPLTDPSSIPSGSSIASAGPSEPDRPASSPSVTASATPSTESSPVVFSGAVVPDAVSILVSAVVDDDRIAEMDFFSDTGAGEGIGVDQGSAWSGLTFAVVDEMTGIVIDWSITGADGRATLDGEIDAPFYLLAEATGAASRSFVLPRRDRLGLWVAAYVGSPTPEVDGPSAPDATDFTQPAVVEPIGGDVVAVGADPHGSVVLSLPDAGTGTEGSGSNRWTSLLITLMAILTFALSLARVGLTRRA